MPRRKPKPEKQIQEKIKEALDSIVDDDFQLESVTAGDLPRLKSTEILNIQEQANASGSDARNLLDKMVDFYLDSNLIGEDDHVSYKKKIDSMNLSSMLLQLRSSQHVITKIMEEIDFGNMHPRLIEVLVQLQSQIIQMPKDYQNYMERMEDSYKRLKVDYEQKKLRGGIVFDQETEDGEYVLPPGNGIKVRGNKNLMENLRDIIGSEIEDVTIEDLDTKAVVNARTKLDIDAARNPDGQDGSDSDAYDIEDDLFST